MLIIKILFTHKDFELRGIKGFLAVQSVLRGKSAWQGRFLESRLGPPQTQPASRAHAGWLVAAFLSPAALLRYLVSCNQQLNQLKPSD